MTHDRSINSTWGKVIIISRLDLLLHFSPDILCNEQQKAIYLQYRPFQLVPDLFKRSVVCVARSRGPNPSWLGTLGLSPVFSYAYLLHINLLWTTQIPPTNHPTPGLRFASHLVSRSPVFVILLLQSSSPPNLLVLFPFLSSGFTFFRRFLFSIYKLRSDSTCTSTLSSSYLAGRLILICTICGGDAVRQEP